MKPPLITVETITPTIAAQMLGTSAGNRHLRKTAVNRYAREMIAGRWVLNGEAIKFDTAGHLIDGHHRLNAIIASKMSIQLFVIRNVQEGAMLTLDTGVGRSFFDASVVAGRGWGRMVGPIARWWHMYERDGLTRTIPTASLQELTQIAETHLTIHDSAHHIRKLKVVCRHCVPGVQGFVHAYVSEKYDREIADVFFRDLNDGAELDAHSPIFLLRRYLIEDSSRKNPEANRVLAVTIKAWNAWMAGDKLSVLVWRKDEAFPRFDIDVAKASPSLVRSRKIARRRIAGKVGRVGAAGSAA